MLTITGSVYIVVTYMPIQIHGVYTHEDGAKEAIAHGNYVQDAYDIIEVPINAELLDDGYE